MILFKICIYLMINESFIKLQSYATAHILIYHDISREIVPGHFVGILRPEGVHSGF